MLNTIWLLSDDWLAHFRGLGGVAGLVRGVTGEGVKREGEEISRKGGLSGHPECGRRNAGVLSKSSAECLMVDSFCSEPVYG